MRFSTALVVFVALVFFSAMAFGLAWWASTGEFWAVSSREERASHTTPSEATERVPETAEVAAKENQRP